MTKFEQGVMLLDQLEDELLKWEKEKDLPHLALGRICYFLLERWVRSEDGKPKGE